MCMANGSRRSSRGSAPARRVWLLGLSPAAELQAELQAAAAPTRRFNQQPSAGKTGQHPPHSPGGRCCKTSLAHSRWGSRQPSPPPACSGSTCGQGTKAFCLESLPHAAGAAECNGRGIPANLPGRGAINDGQGCGLHKAEVLCCAGDGLPAAGRLHAGRPATAPCGGRQQQRSGGRRRRQVVEGRSGTFCRVDCGADASPDRSVWQPGPVDQQRRRAARALPQTRVLSGLARCTRLRSLGSITRECAVAQGCWAPKMRVQHATRDSCCRSRTPPTPV